MLRNAKAHARATSRKPVRRPLMEVSALESRLLLSALAQETYLRDAFGVIVVDDELPDEMVWSAFPSSTPLGANPLSAVPVLNSNPGATAKLFLDFNGAAAMTWGSYSATTTPAYTQDGDATTFTDAELNAIRQIWARVAEAYSPFNLNVTTVDPGVYGDKQAIRVVIGGNGSWYSQAGGVAYLGSFYNSSSNTAWVFSANLGSGHVKYTADAAIHEAGHTFGLQHQSTYSGTTRTAEYSQGNSAVAPNMGVAYYSTRGLWITGPTTSSTTIQDDLAVLSNLSNGFGYRTDDFGGTTGTAGALSVSDNTVTASGIIERSNDQDYFSFSTQAGPVSFVLSVASYGPMLDASLRILDSLGNTVITAATSSFGETISTTLGAGTYYLVAYASGYGNLGQYSISGSIIASADYVAAPTNITARVSGTAVDLSWQDNAVNEVNYILERSTDGGASWSPLATLDADTEAYQDAGLTVGATYQYRLYAVGAVENSLLSAVATAAITAPVPTALAALVLSNDRIRLTWNAAADATGYRLERSLTGTSGWTWVSTLGADATSYTDTGLAGNTRYYYRICSTSTAGNSAYAASVNGLTAPAVPVPTLSVLSSSQIRVSWADVAGETGYKVEWSPDGADWSLLTTTAANTTSYIQSGLTANTRYYYRIRAVGGAAESNNSVTVNAWTMLPNPTGVTATAASSSQINLGWADLTGESGYRVERSTDNVNWTTAATLGADVTSYSAGGLGAGTLYYFRIRGLSFAAPSTSSVVSVPTLTAAPTPLLATANSSSQITLTWANVAGETGYRLQYSTDNSTWNTLTTLGANVTTYTHSGLTANTTYYYRVAGVNGSGLSSFATASRMTRLMPPAGLTIGTVTSSTADLSWIDSTDETGYRIERSSDNATWTSVATPAADATSLTLSGLTAGTRYYFRIKALNSGGESAGSASVSTTTVPAVPTLRTTSVSPTQIALAWTDLAGETAYKLQTSDDGSDWTDLANLAANVVAYTHSGLTTNTLHYYRLLASNAAGASAYSASVSRTTTLVAPTGLAATATSASQVSLSWEDHSLETGYRIERSTNGTTWTSIAMPAANATSQTVTGLAAGTLYYFRLKAINAGGDSPASTTAMATTVPGTPTGLTATSISAGQVNLAWTNLTGETGYKIQVSTDNASFSDVATVGANVVSYAHTGLSANTRYYYRVLAQNAAGQSSYTASVNALTRIATPADLTATASSATQINLTWSDTTGETGYRIESMVAGGTWAVRATVASGVTSYAHAGLTAGSTVSYRVKALNAAGESAASAIATATTIPPAVTGLTISSIAATSATLTWANPPGESGFTVQFSTNGSTWAAAGSVGANVLTYTHTGLTANTLYYYRVVAGNAAGNAGPSSTVSRRTLMAAPGGLAVSSPSGTRVNVTWSDSADETGYVLERSTDGVAFTTRATLVAGTTSFADTTVIAGTRYVYRLRAVNGSGNSAPTASVAITTRPTATTLSGTVMSATQINLSWTNVAGETGYRIERSADGSSWSTLTTAGANVITYSNTGLTTGTTYYYRVIAFNAAGDASASAAINRRTL